MGTLWPPQLGAPRDRAEPPRGRVSRAVLFAASCQVALAASAGWLVWIFDDWRAISLAYPEYFSWVAGSLLVVLAPALAWRRPGAFLIPSVLCVFLALLPHADTTALKPLLRGAKALTPGMHRSEILATIHGEFAGTPYDLPLLLDDSEDRILLRARPFPGNSESLHIALRDARFVRAWFSPD